MYAVSVRVAAVDAKKSAGVFRIPSTSFQCSQSVIDSGTTCRPYSRHSEP